MDIPDPKTLEEFGAVLRRLADQDVDLHVRAELWRAGYSKALGAERHQCRLIAYDTGLGGATGDEWVDDVTSPPWDQHGFKIVGWRGSQYYRGCEIGAVIEQKEGMWACRVSIRDYTFRTLFSTHFDNIDSLEAAYISGMSAATREIDRLLDGAIRLVGGGRPPESILGES